MIAWLLKNPLASILGILGLVALVATGVQTVRLDNAQVALAEEKLAGANFKRTLAEASLKVSQDAADRSQAQVTALIGELRTISSIGQQAKTEIRYVASNGGPCGQDPVYLGTVDRVNRVLDLWPAGRGAGRAEGPAGSVAPAGVRKASAPR